MYIHTHIYVYMYIYTWRQPARAAVRDSVIFKAADTPNMRSQFGDITMLHGCVVRCGSKHLEIIAISITTEAKYVREAHQTSELPMAPFMSDNLWRTSINNDYMQHGHAMVSEDLSVGAIKLKTTNPIVSNRAKHIDGRHHYTR